MQPVRLVQIAAEAEALRWHGFAARTMTRVLCAAIGLLFAAGALAVAHIAAWYALRIDAGLAFYWAALLIGGFDVLVAVVLLAYAWNSTPGRVEREAVQVRKQALAGVAATLSLVQLGMIVMRFARSMGRRGPKA
jgi:Na+/melibiose symporter-like transporter